MSFQAFNPDLLPKPVSDPLGWRRISLKEACRIGAEAAEKGWPWKDNMLRDGRGRPVMLANHPNFPPTYWVPTEAVEAHPEIQWMKTAICRERCAAVGDPPCFSLEEYDGTCHAEARCEDLAAVALAALGACKDAREEYINAAQPARNKTEGA